MMTNAARMLWRMRNNFELCDDEVDKREISPERLALNEARLQTVNLRGGVTALGGRKSYPVFVDESIELLDVVAVSAGVRGDNGSSLVGGIMQCPLDSAKHDQDWWSNALARANPCPGPQPWYASNVPKPT